MTKEKILKSFSVVMAVLAIFFCLFFVGCTQTPIKITDNLTEQEQTDTPVTDDTDDNDASAQGSFAQINESIFEVLSDFGFDKSNFTIAASEGDGYESETLSTSNLSPFSNVTVDEIKISLSEALTGFVVTFNCEIELGSFTILVILQSV